MAENPARSASSKRARLLGAVTARQTFFQERTLMSASKMGIVLLFAAGVGCGAAPAGSGSVNQATEVAPPAQADYYVVRPDTRLCAYPECGRFFLRSLTSDTTTCADGRVAKECYVVDFLGSQILVGQAQTEGAVVLGSFVPRSPTSAVPLEDFQLSGVWVANQDNGKVAAAPGDLFYLARPDLTPVCPVDAIPGPGCGGLFLTAIDQPSTICADGQPAAECRVVSVTSSDPELAAAARGFTILRGQIKTVILDPPAPIVGKAGIVDVTAVWQRFPPPPTPL
jgi:hypothetical protein